MKYLFIGCVKSSYQLLVQLIEETEKNSEIEVVGVITKEKSNFNADFMDLRPLCNKNNIECICVENINDGVSRAFIERKKPDVGLCFGWSQLVKADVINLFSRGMFGFHPAALPYNRGRHPIIWALVLGLSETASTFFRLEETADTGNIVSQVALKIEYEDDAQSLYGKIMDCAIQQEAVLIKKLENNSLAEQKQVITGTNSWRKRTRPDGIIDWRMSSRAIYNLVRALTHPYVGAEFEYNNQIIKVWKVREVQMKCGYENMEPGKVLNCNANGTIDIKCYDGVIQLVDFEPLEIEEGAYL